MDNDNRRLMIDTASTPRQQQVTLGNTAPSQKYACRRLPPEPLARLSREITTGNGGDLSRFAGRVACSYDILNDFHQMPVHHQSDSTNIDNTEQVSGDRRRVASSSVERRRNITELTAAERQLRRQQDYCRQNRQWNSLELPPESAIGSSRRCPLPSTSPTTDHPEYENSKQASNRRVARQLSSRVEVNARGTIVNARRVSPADESLRSRGVPVRTGSVDVVTGRKLIEVAGYRPATEDSPDNINIRSRPTSIQPSSSLSRSRSDCYQNRPRQSNISPFDLRRQEPQDRRAVVSEHFDDGRQTGDEPMKSRTGCHLPRGAAVTTRHQEPTRRLEYSSQPVVYHRLTPNNMEHTQVTDTIYTSDDDDSHNTRTSLLQQTAMTDVSSRSQQMKVRDDSGYKSIESQLSRLSFGGWISEQVPGSNVDQQHSPAMTAIDCVLQHSSTFTRHLSPEPLTSVSSASATASSHDSLVVKSEVSKQQNLGQHEQHTEVARVDNLCSDGSTDQSRHAQWLVEWTEWRKGHESSAEVNQTGKEVTQKLTTLHSENEMPKGKQPLVDITQSPEKKDEHSMSTSGSGLKLDVLKNLTRGLEKTFSDAEQSLGSVLSQAAERLLKRRTSSADETGPSSAAVADMAAELSLAAGYGIPARCADNFVRTSYKTASRRRHEFRTRCGRLNNEEEMSNVYRDSV